MPKILIIADDLTGAAELAGIAKSGGFTVKLYLHPPGVGRFEEEVMVMNTNTRPCNPHEARNIINKWMEGLDFKEFDFIYKKTDSVLRGPVATELNTVMGLTGLQNTLLVPANPDNKRMIREGKYFIDGVPIHETLFKDAPHYPRKYAEVVKLIIDNNGIVKYSEDTLGEFEHPTARVIIPPVTSKEDLQNLAQKMAGKQILMAGGADFFREILKIMFQIEFDPYFRSVEKQSYSRKEVFIWGSHPGHWLAHMWNFDLKNFGIIHMPAEIANVDQDNALWKKWQEEVLEKVRAFPKIIITSPKASLTGKDQLQNITRHLGQLSRQLFTEIKAPAAFYIEGGETAQAIIEGLNWNELHIHEALGYGVVLVKYRDSHHEIIIKPGSYAWPSGILPRSGPDFGVQP